MSLPSCDAIFRSAMVPLAGSVQVVRATLYRDVPVLPVVHVFETNVVMFSPQCAVVLPTVQTASSPLGHVPVPALWSSLNCCIFDSFEGSAAIDAFQAASVK